MIAVAVGRYRGREVTDQRANTAEFTIKKDGKPVGTTTRTVSKDGKILTSKSKTTTAKGKTENVMVFDKQS